MLLPPRGVGLLVSFRPPNAYSDPKVAVAHMPLTFPIQVPCFAPGDRSPDAAVASISLLRASPKWRTSAVPLSSDFLRFSECCCGTRYERYLSFRIGLAGPWTLQMWLWPACRSIYDCDNFSVRGAPSTFSCKSPGAGASSPPPVGGCAESCCGPCPVRGLA